MTPSVSFSLDLILICRCLAALLWGVVLAIFLQRTRAGKWLVHERTWICVVLGVGVDLLLCVAGEWLDFVAVVAFSSVGIIARSLTIEAENLPSGYKVLWGLEDSTAIANELIDVLEEVVTEIDRKRQTRRISEALKLAHCLAFKLRATRRGEYEQRKPSSASAPKG